MYQLIQLYPSDNFAHRYGVYPEDRFAIAPDWNHHNGRLVLCMQSPANAGSTRHLDEVFVTLRGEPYLLWPGFDQHGADPLPTQPLRDQAGTSR